MNWYKNLLNKIKLTIAVVIGYSLTMFLFLNSYEILAVTDMPVIEAVNQISLVNTIAITEQKISNHKGIYGEPILVRIPTENLKLEVVPQLLNNYGKELCYMSKVHYIPTTNNKDGLMGDMILYMKEDWRTVDPEDLNIGDNIFIDTKKDWRYMYKITKKTPINKSSQYIFPESEQGKMILLIEDTETNSGYLYEMDYISVQIQ